MNSRHGVLFSGLGSLALLVALSACGSSSAGGGGSVGGGGNPPSNPITVTCTPAKLGLYQAGKCSAVVTDKAGNPVSPQPDVSFSSSDENIIQINAYGGFGTYAIGSATITVFAPVYGNSLPTTVEVTTAGSSNCGTFTTSKDAAGADFNGLSSNPVYSPTPSGSLSSRTITCRGDQSVGGKRVLRTVSIDMGYGSLVAGQSYPANIELFEEQVNVAYRDWKNTKGTADVRLESMSGNQYRFTYTNILLAPETRYATQGNLTMSGDITATMR
jgi:hypothetical protein